MPKKPLSKVWKIIIAYFTIQAGLKLLGATSKEEFIVSLVFGVLIVAGIYSLADISREKQS